MPPADRRTTSRPTLDGRLVSGWREYIDLPEWGVQRLQAKLDTGARTSAIDVGHLEELPDNRVRFDVAVDRKHLDRWVTVEADIVRRTRIKSSFGAAHERLVVATIMRLGGIEKRIEVSLVSRRRMICRMLLGRFALEPDFLIDSSSRYLLSQPRMKRKRKAAHTAATTKRKPTR